MNIRPAERHLDHDRLCKLARTSEFTRDFSSIMFSSDGAYGRGWIRVCEGDDTNLLGFTCVRHKVMQPKTVLYFITVEPAVRSHKIGERLMLDLEQQTPHGLIHLNVSHRNERAKAFYLRLGYRVVRDDAISGTAWELEKAVPKKVR